MASNVRTAKTPMNAAQEMFAREYLANGRNAKAAYMKAYPNSSEENARKCGWELLKKPAVNKFIQEETKARYEALDITAEHIAQELAEMAFAMKGDEDYTAQIKLKAMDLLQKQLGLQNKNVSVNADVNAGIQFVEDYGSEGN